MTFWIDDLDIFFGDFGQDVIWKTLTLRGIFHNEYEAITLFGSDVESRNPFVELKDSDIVGLIHNDILTIEGVSYKVVNPQPDGTGITIVMLTKGPVIALPGETIVAEPGGEAITTETGEGLET